MAGIRRIGGIRREKCKACSSYSESVVEELSVLITSDQASFFLKGEGKTVGIVFSLETMTGSLITQ